MAVGRGKTLVAWLCTLGACLVLARLGAAEPTSKFGFHIFPPANGQDLGYAQRPVSDGKGGFWFLNIDQIWRFDASGYRALGPVDGLSGPVYTALAEPSTGMWVATATGWVHLGAQGAQAEPSIPAFDGKGRTFLPIRNLGLGMIMNGRLHIFGAKDPAGTDLPSPGSGEWIKGWKNPASAELLVVGDQGLARWNGSAWRIQPLKGLLDGRGWDVLRVRSGALWVRSDRDMARVEPAPARFGPRLEFTRNSFVTMEEDSFGRVWTNGPEGLACVDGDQVWRISAREGLYGDHSYWPLAFDQQGCLWTISTLGFQRLKGAFLWSVQERAHGLPRAMIFQIQRLPDGRLYAGTHDGLYRRVGQSWSILPGTERWALFTLGQRENGEIWAGGNPPENHYQTLLRIRPGQPAVRPVIQGYPTGDWTTSLCWDGADRLWTITNTGFYRVEARGENFQAKPEALPGLGPEESPNWIGRGPDQAIWVATDHGLYLRQGEGWKRFTRAEGMAADDSVVAFAGPNGELWVLHDASKAITRLHRLPGQGWTVAGTLGPGHPLTSHGGLGGWTDGQGVVWIQNHNEVIRWDGVRAEHHTAAYGLPNATLWAGSITGDPDGHMYIGSVSGLVCFDPRFYQRLPDPPALELGAAMDGQGHRFRPKAALPFDRAGISFDIMVPLGDGVEDLQCQTRLAGLDGQWSALEGHLQRYPGLAPGRYILEARASRRDGQFGPTLSFPFRILPSWYARPWALLVMALLALGLASLLWRWRTWALHREQLRLETLVARRTSDLVEANDALVQALGEVKTLQGLVPICSYCKKIRDDSGFWNQMERFIQDHSHAKFSHGICPQCEVAVRQELEEEDLLTRR